MKDLPKIIELFPEPADTTRESMLNVLNDMIQDVKDGKIQRFCMAAKLSDDTIGTGYANCNAVEIQEFASHLQIDATYKLIRATIMEAD